MGYETYVGNYAVSGGTSTESIANAPKESPLSEELGALVNGLAELEQCVAALGIALGPVSIPEPPQAQSNQTSQLMPNTRGPVVDSLVSSNARVSNIIRSVGRIRSNLSV